MKMKIGIRLMLFVCCFLICVAAHATPIHTGEAFNIAFSGHTCTSCWGNQTLPSVAFDGLLTVAPVTGRFWDPWFTDYFMENVNMVTGITGNLTIDCHGLGGCVGDGTYALSFLQAPLGDGSYLLFGSTPRYLVFSAIGSGLDTRFINDNAFNLFQWNTQVPVNFSTTFVPELSSLALLGIALSAVMCVAGKLSRKIPKQLGVGR